MDKTNARRFDPSGVLPCGRDKRDPLALRVWHLLALLVVVDRLAEAVVVAGVELRPHEIVADITIIH